MRFFLIFLVVLALVPGAWATWQSDSAIASGLGDVGQASTPSVFFKDGTWYLISGENIGVFYGYNWTGSQWQYDSAINASLGDVGFRSTPSVFFKDGTWYLISGEIDGVFYGYNWTGSQWQYDSAINASLGDVGFRSTPSVFFKDGTWYLISGNSDGVFYGYNYTGSQWQYDSVINASLGDVGDISNPYIFFKDSTLYLISGEDVGTFYGYNYTGSQWEHDSAINASLGDVGDRSAPSVFFKDITLYLISGESDGTFNGFNWTTTVTTPTLNSPADDFSTTNTTITLNASHTDDLTFYWYNGSDLISDSAEPVNSSGLVGAWHFNEGTSGNRWITDDNDTVIDYSGNGNTGNITGAEWVRGRFEKGLEFDGIDDYVVVSDDNSLDVQAALTMSAWVYLKSGDDIPHTGIINKGDESGGATDGYRIHYNTNNNQFQAAIVIGTTSYTTTGGDSFTNNTWHYVVGTYDGVNLKSYIDGVEVGTKTASGNINSISADVEIGRANGAKFFNGTIDEPRIYDRALSAAEILENYNKGIGTVNWNRSTVTEGEQTWTAQASDSYTNSSQATSNTLHILIAPDTCPSGTGNELTVFTYNLVDEETLATTTGFIGSVLTIDHNGTDYIFTVSNSSTSTLSVCVDNVYLNSLIDVDVTFHNGSTWPLGSWFVRSRTINTSTLTQTLALLNTTFTTESHIYIIDDAGNQAQNFFVTLHRYDYDNSRWQSLRMSKTDFDGKAVFFLRSSDRYYSFYVYDETMTFIQMFSNYIISTLETTLHIDITAFSYLTSALTKIESSCTTPTNASINCTVTDNNNPLRVTTTILKTWKGGAVNFTQDCEDTSTSNPATVSCAIDPTEIYYYVLKVDMNPPAVLTAGFLGSFPQDDYGAIGIFILALMALAMGFAGAYNPQMFTIFMFIGYVMGSVIGLISVTDGMAVSLLATLTLIVVWRLKNR